MSTARQLAEVAAAKRYTPIDELLETLRVRVLRALRRFDWVSSEDIALAIDIRDDQVENYNAQLYRLSRDRFVDRRGAIVRHFTYRINDRGRAELARLLQRGALPEVSL